MKTLPSLGTELGKSIQKSPSIQAELTSHLQKGKYLLTSDLTHSNIHCQMTMRKYPQRPTPSVAGGILNIPGWGLSGVKVRD